MLARLQCSRGTTSLVSGQCSTDSNTSDYEGLLTDTQRHMHCLMHRLKKNLINIYRFDWWRYFGGMNYTFAVIGLL